MMRFEDRSAVLRCRGLNHVIEFESKRRAIYPMPFFIARNHLIGYLKIGKMATLVCQWLESSQIERIDLI